MPEEYTNISEGIEKKKREPLHHWSESPPKGKLREITETIFKAYEKLKSTPEGIANRVRSKLLEDDARDVIDTFNEWIRTSQSEMILGKIVGSGVGFIGSFTVVGKGIYEMTKSELMTNFVVGSPIVQNGLMYATWLTLSSGGAAGAFAGDAIDRITGRVESVIKIRKFINENLKGVDKNKLE